MGLGFKGPVCNKWGAHPGKTALSANLDVLGTKNDDMGGLSLKEPDCNKWGAHPGKTALSDNLDVVGTDIWGYFWSRPQRPRLQQVGRAPR